jgi:hypothetical protein
MVKTKESEILKISLIEIYLSWWKKAIIFLISWNQPRM